MTPTYEQLLPWQGEESVLIKHVIWNHCLFHIDPPKRLEPGEWAGPLLWNPYESECEVCNAVRAHTEAERFD